MTYGEITVPPFVFVAAEQMLYDHAPTLVEAAAAGVRDVIAEMASQPQVRVLRSKWDEGDYGSIDWFVQRALIDNPAAETGQQVLWNRLLTDLTRDPARASVPHL